MPRNAAKARKTAVPPAVKKAVAALPARDVPAPKLVPAAQVMARQAQNDALYRKLFAKPAKASKGRGASATST